jgi:hypothetical protein
LLAVLVIFFGTVLDFEFLLGNDQKCIYEKTEGLVWDWNPPSANRFLFHPLVTERTSQT